MDIEVKDIEGSLMRTSTAFLVAYIGEQKKTLSRAHFRGTAKQRRIKGKELELKPSTQCLRPSIVTSLSPYSSSSVSPVFTELLPIFSRCESSVRLSDIKESRASGRGFSKERKQRISKSTVAQTQQFLESRRRDFHFTHHQVIFWLIFVSPIPFQLSFLLLFSSPILPCRSFLLLSCLSLTCPTFRYLDSFDNHNLWCSMSLYSPACLCGSARTAGRQQIHVVHMGCSFQKQQFPC